MFYNDLKRSIFGAFITNDFVCRVIDPLAVFIVGLLFWLLLHTILGPFLMICSVALYYEEYIPYARRREKILDKIDAEYEAEKIKELLKIYDDNDKRSGSTSASKKRVPATFANSSDYEAYRTEMRKQSSGGESARLN